MALAIETPRRANSTSSKRVMTMAVVFGIFMLLKLYFYRASTLYFETNGELMKILSSLALMLITTIAHAAPVNGHFTLDSDRGDAAGFGVAVWGGVPSHPGPAVPLSYDGTFAVDSALLGQADGTYSLANYLTAFELKIGGVTFDISNAKSADLYSVAIANHEITGMRLIIESSFMAPNTSSIIFSMTTNGAWAAASTVAQGYTSTTVYGGADHARFYTDYVAAPVPEPETYGMLVSGLGLMGVVARRRKSRA